MCMCVCVVWVARGQASIHTKTIVFVMLDTKHLSSASGGCVIKGCQVWLKSGPDWHIRFQYIFFVSSRQNIMKSDRKKPRICGQSDPLGSPTRHPCSACQLSNKMQLWLVREGGREGGGGMCRDLSTRGLS